MPKKTHSSNVTLYRKYRPKIFADMMGQEHVVQILKAEVAKDAVSHAYIFIGPRGTGKTSAARILAKAVNCLNPTVDGDACNRCDTCKAINNNTFLDLIEIDAASNRGIDNIRELQERVSYPPSQGKRKLYIIDEVHMLTKEAFNALLKTLEEPPEHVIFVLATTEPHKVPETILSRCERLDFHLADHNTLVTYLQNIADLEGIKIEQKALELIADQAMGSYRDALSLLGAVVSVDKNITLELVQKVLKLPDTQAIVGLLINTFNAQTEGVNQILDTLESQGFDMATLLTQTTRFMRKEILSKKLPYEEWKGAVKLLGNFLKAIEKMRYVFDQRLLVESALWDFMIWVKDNNLTFVVILEILGEPSKGGSGVSNNKGRVKKIAKAVDKVVKSKKNSKKQVLVKKSEIGKEETDGQAFNKAPKDVLLDILKGLKAKNGKGVVYPIFLKAQAGDVLFNKDKKVWQFVVKVPDYPLFRKKLDQNGERSLLNSLASKSAGVEVELIFEFDSTLNGSAPKRILKGQESSIKRPVQNNTPPPTHLEKMLLNKFGDNLETL